MSDHGKSPDDMAQQAPELIDQLNLLEAIDRRLTPEHVVRRFRDLLDDIGDEGQAVPVTQGEDGSAEEEHGSLKPTQSSVPAEFASLPTGRGALEGDTDQENAAHKVAVRDRPGWVLPAASAPGAPRPVGPVHRLIFAVDIEKSTERTNLAKGKLRHFLYELLDRAFEAAGIASGHLEPFTDRGDSVLILIRPHDEVPKTLVLGRLIPILTTLLTEHNASFAHPELRIRLRAVVHAGEVHEDANGFYGDDLDAAFRLVEAPTLKRALREAMPAPLILVVSDEIFNGIVRQGYLDDSSYQPLVRVKVGRRRRRGWVHIPAVPAGRPGVKGQLPTAPLSIAAMNSHSPDQAEAIRHGGDRVVAVEYEYARYLSTPTG